MTSLRHTPIATYRGVPITIAGPGLSVRYAGMVVRDALRMRGMGWSWELIRASTLLWAHQWQPQGCRGELAYETWIAMHQRLMDAVEGVVLPEGAAL